MGYTGITGAPTSISYKDITVSFRMLMIVVQFLLLGRYLPTSFLIEISSTILNCLVHIGLADQVFIQIILNCVWGHSTSTCPRTLRATDGWTLADRNGGL